MHRRTKQAGSHQKDLTKCSSRHEKENHSAQKSPPQASTQDTGRRRKQKDAESNSSSSSDSSGSESSSVADEEALTAKKSSRSRYTDRRATGRGCDDGNDGETTSSLKQRLRELQQQVDEYRVQSGESTRQLANITNETDAQLRKRKSSASDDLDETKDRKKQKIKSELSIAKEIDDVGKHFTVQHHPFVDMKQLRELKISRKYSPEERFDPKKPQLEQQGILYDILELLPRSLAKKCKKQKFIDEWILSQMKSAMSTERSVAARRIRKQVGDEIFGCERSLLCDDDQRGQHADLGALGLQPGSDNFFNVEILHTDYAGQLDINTIFLNPVLMQAYSALVYGNDSVKQIKAGQPPAPKVETNSAIWSLKEVTPGAIATASVVVLYAISSDCAFRQQGGSTGIDWQEVHRQYFKYLWKGKMERRSSVLNIFRTWNNTLYPNMKNDTILKKPNTNPLKEAEKALENDLQELSDEEDEDQGPQEEQVGG